MVLLQSGKSADLAGAFGGMGSQSTFGPRGAATFIAKATTTLAILFMVTSLALFIASTKKKAPPSVMEGEKSEITETADAPKPAAGEMPKPTDGTKDPAVPKKEEPAAGDEKKDDGSTEKKDDGTTGNK